MYFRALKFLSYFIEMALFGLFGKTKKENLNKGLEKTKESVFKKLARVVVGKSKVDDEVLDNLEEVLITSDVGVETTVRIIERIEERVQRDKYMGVDELNRVLKEEIVALLKENTVNDAASFELPENGVPYVIMVVGVNGKRLRSESWPINLKKPVKKWYWELPILFVLLLSINW